MMPIQRYSAARRPASTLAMAMATTAATLVGWVPPSAAAAGSRSDAVAALPTSPVAEAAKGNAYRAPAARVDQAGVARPPSGPAPRAQASPTLNRQATAEATRLNPQPLPPQSRPVSPNLPTANDGAQKTGIIIVGGKPVRAGGPGPQPAAPVDRAPGAQR